MEENPWRLYILVTIFLSIAVAIFLNAVYKIFSNFPGIRTRGGFSAADGLSAASDSLATVLGVAVALAGSWVAINLARQANNQSKLSVSLEEKIKSQNDFSIYEGNFERICSILERCQAAIQQIDLAARTLRSAVDRGNLEEVRVARTNLQNSLVDTAAQLRQMYVNPILGEAWQASSRRCRQANWLPVGDGEGEGANSSEAPMEPGNSSNASLSWERVLCGASENLVAFAKDEGKSFLDTLLLEYKSCSEETQGNVFFAMKKNSGELSELAPYWRELEEYFCGSVRGYELIARILSDGWQETKSADLDQLKIDLGLMQPVKPAVSLGNFSSDDRDNRVGSDSQAQVEGSCDPDQNDLEFIWKSLADPLMIIDALFAWAKMVGDTPPDELRYNAKSLLPDAGVSGSSGAEMDERMQLRVQTYYADLAIGAWTGEFERSGGDKAQAPEGGSGDPVEGEPVASKKMTVDLGTLALASFTLCLPRIDDIVCQSRNRMDDSFNVHADPNKIRAIAYLLDAICPEMRTGLESSPSYLFRVK